MRTTNKQWRVLAMMMIVAICAGFASCGGDDDDDNNEPKKGNTDDSSWVVGSWIESGGGRKWTFHSGGKCDFYLANAEINRKTGEIKRTGWTLSQSGTWKYNAERMLLTTNIKSWNWEIISFSSDSWTGKTVNGKNSSIYTFDRE